MHHCHGYEHGPEGEVIRTLDDGIIEVRRVKLWRTQTGYVSFDKDDAKRSALIPLMKAIVKKYGLDKFDCEQRGAGYYPSRCVVDALKCAFENAGDGKEGSLDQPTIEEGEGEVFSIPEYDHSFYSGAYSNEEDARRSEAYQRVKERRQQQRKRISAAAEELAQDGPCQMSIEVPGARVEVRVIPRR